jgi:hypothetical protein
MVKKEESERRPLEEHLLACSSCVKRAETTRDYVDAIRAAIIEGFTTWKPDVQLGWLKVVLWVLWLLGSRASPW